MEAIKTKPSSSLGLSPPSGAAAKMASARMRQEEQRDLTAFLADVTAVQTELWHRAWGPIDAVRTYTANCRRAPAARLVRLPGFGARAIERDGASAVAAFARFAGISWGSGCLLYTSPSPRDS